MIPNVEYAYTTLCLMCACTCTMRIRLFAIKGMRFLSCSASFAPRMPLALPSHHFDLNLVSWREENNIAHRFPLHNRIPTHNNKCLSLRRDHAVSVATDAHLVVSVVKMSISFCIHHSGSKRISTLCHYGRTTRIIFAGNVSCIYLRTHIKWNRIPFVGRALRICRQINGSNAKQIFVLVRIDTEGLCARKHTHRVRR